MFVEEKAKGEVKELDAASKLLLQAADLIEKVGLAKEALHNDDGYCVLGALNQCAENDWMATFGHSPANLQARVRLCNALGRDVIHWNNASSRTKAQVVAKMRAVAFSS